MAVGCVYKDVGGIFDTGEAGKLNQITDEDIEAGGERFYNLLLLGIDYDADDSGRDYAEGKGNTDVILYVQVNRDNGKVNVLQIPRDSSAITSTRPRAAPAPLARSTVCMHWARIRTI